MQATPFLLYRTTNRGGRGAGQKEQILMEIKRVIDEGVVEIAFLSDELHYLAALLGRTACDDFYVMPTLSTVTEAAFKAAAALAELCTDDAQTGHVNARLAERPDAAIARFGKNPNGKE